MQVNKSCLICSSTYVDQYQPFYNAHGLLKCTSCKFIFMEKIPSEQELTDYYAQYSYSEDAYLSPLTIKSYNLLLDEFEKYRKHNRILDVGCGRGWFLQEAKKRGWVVYGTEYSSTALDLCNNEGIKMHSGALTENAFESNYFDVVTSFEVLEHINNPQEEIKSIYKFLRRGGLFYITTPNFNSYLRYQLKEKYNIICYPEHLSYYTRKSLKYLLSNNNFKTNKVLTTGISLTRLRTSKNNGSEAIISEVSSDEKLRKRISKNRILKLTKNLVNRALTLFGVGITLKGYFTK